MFPRARTICAGLLAAATTAVLVGAPAVVQAGITALERSTEGADDVWTNSSPWAGPLAAATIRGLGRGAGDDPCRHQLQLARLRSRR